MLSAQHTRSWFIRLKQAIDDRQALSSPLGHSFSSAGMFFNCAMDCLVLSVQLISHTYQGHQKSQFGLSAEVTFDCRSNHCSPQKEPEEANAKCPAILERAVSTRGVAPS